MVTTTKPKTDTEKLVEKFNKWCDERILDYRIIPPASDSHRRSLLARIDTLEFAKKNINRLAQEIAGDNGS